MIGIKTQLWVKNLTRVGFETGLRSQAPDSDPAYESVAES